MFEVYKDWRSHILSSWNNGSILKNIQVLEDEGVRKGKLWWGRNMSKRL